MAFVKLDCQMLDSSIWIERLQREVFITALLMASPIEITEPTPALCHDSLDKTGFIVPPGWYGFVGAASSGIVCRAQIEGREFEAAMEAIKELGEEDPFSRSQAFEGRRMVRVDGGFIILNYDRFREKDHTAAERSRRYRERKASQRVVTSRNVANGVTGRSVTQAEEEVKAEVKEQIHDVRTCNDENVTEHYKHTFNSTEAAMGYCHTFSVVGQKNYDAIRQAIELGQRNGSSQSYQAQHIADQMIAARQEYEALAGKKFEYPAVSFITSGIWKTPRKWKNGKSEPTEEELSQQLGASLR